MSSCFEAIIQSLIPPKPYADLSKSKLRFPNSFFSFLSMDVGIPSQMGIVALSINIMAITVYTSYKKT